MNVLVAEDVRLLDALSAEGLLVGGRRAIIERERADGGVPLTELLADSGFVCADTLARLVDDAMAIDLDGEAFIPDARAVACLDATTARRLMIVPLTLDADNKVLTLASVTVPDLPARDRVRRVVTARVDLNWRVASASSISRALDRSYGVGLALDEIVRDCDEARDSQVLIAAGRDDTESLSPIVRLVDGVLSEAVARRASDIHFNPEERFLRVRFRIDGVLEDIVCLQRRHVDALVVRLKVLAGADIAETRHPQDGRFTRRLLGRRIDFRLSSFPVRTGENVVLRVIERYAAAATLSTLQLPRDMTNRLRERILQPEGLIVVAGPTGSGKTTTLYALLGELDTVACNIMTLEDPVEHLCVGIRQASLDAARGLDYANGVRALLRQDPDVLLIGEIRDADSCAMALRAALTGHRVLTTVHADDAIGALGRLRELGAESGVLADVLSCVIAQRLLRIRCSNCKPGSSETLCTRCRGRGLHGRRAVIEALLPSLRLKARLRAGDDREALSRIAFADGHVSLRAGAEQLVESGDTTVEEMTRVLGSSPDEGDDQRIDDHIVKRTDERLDERIGDTLDERLDERNSEPLDERPGERFDERSDAGNVSSSAGTQATVANGFVNEGQRQGAQRT